MANDKVSDQKGMPRVAQSPVPGQPGTGCSGSIWPFDRQMMAASFFNQPMLQRTERILTITQGDSMLLDYLEGQTVVNKGNAAVAKWFKKVEPKL